LFKKLSAFATLLLLLFTEVIGLKDFRTKFLSNRIDAVYRQVTHYKPS